MIDKIQSRFRSQKLSDEMGANFVRELYFTNFNRGRVFTPALLLVYLILAAADLLNREKGLSGIPWLCRVVLHTRRNRRLSPAVDRRVIRQST